MYRNDIIFTTLLKHPISTLGLYELPFLISIPRIQEEMSKINPHPIIKSIRHYLISVKDQECMVVLTSSDTSVAILNTTRTSLTGEREIQYMSIQLPEPPFFIRDNVYITTYSIQTRTDFPPKYAIHAM